MQLNNFVSEIYLQLLLSRAVLCVAKLSTYSFIAEQKRKKERERQAETDD